MSVLINMEMPTSCRACPMKMNCDYCEGWECVCVPLHQQIGHSDDLLVDKRRDDCPLVPAPPHGRLIDADALDKAIGEEVHECEWDNASFSGFRVWDLLDDAPTIIPAEEGE